MAYTLWLPISKGGLSLPHISSCYYAAVLDQTRQWLNTEQLKHWMALEQAFCNTIPLNALLWLAWLVLLTHKCPYLTIKAGLEAAKSKSFILLRLTEVPLNIIAYIIPDIDFSSWIFLGISKIKDILDKDPIYLLIFYLFPFQI